jgi:hypothetical protein
MPAANWSLEHQAAPYTDYTVETTFDSDAGILQSPVAGPAGTPSDIIQVSAPYDIMIVKWTAKRIGRKPLVPSPLRPNDPNAVLKSKTIVPLAPMMDPDGKTKIYRVSGVYVYQLLLPVEYVNVGYYTMGAPPFQTTGKADAENVLGGEDFSTLIV